MTEEEAVELLLKAWEAAKKHEILRNQRLMTGSRKLLYHIKRRRGNLVKLKMCCRNTAFEAAKFCGTLVIQTKKGEKPNWFQPKKSKTDAKVSSKDNLAYSSNPPEGKIFPGLPLRSDEELSELESDPEPDDAIDDADEKMIENLKQRVRKIKFVLCFYNFTALIY